MGTTAGEEERENQELHHTPPGETDLAALHENLQGRPPTPYHTALLHHPPGVGASRWFTVPTTDLCGQRYTT